MTTINDIESILDQLEADYAASVSRLRAGLAAYARDGTRPDHRARDEGAFSYPELRIEYDPELPPPTPARAFARLNQPGIYTTSVARPALFRSYLREQLEYLVRDYQVSVSVGTSASEIPYPYVLDGGQLELEGISTAELSRWFPSSELVHIGDEVADGAWDLALDPTRPLALFDALRTDFSLARLKHYTGTPPEHFQRFVLFTNYVRYVDEFVRFAIGALRDPESRFTGLSVPGGIYDHGDLADAEAQIAAGVWRRHQMPAYHLMTPDGDGITLVNIGVGPSNAKTICDHIAVLRPEAWLMIGHCGGRTAPTPASPSPAVSMNRAASPMPRRRSPPASGGATRCRPII